MALTLRKVSQERVLRKPSHFHEGLFYSKYVASYNSCFNTENPKTEKEFKKSKLPKVGNRVSKSVTQEHLGFMTMRSAQAGTCVHPCVQP